MPRCAGCGSASLVTHATEFPSLPIVAGLPHRVRSLLLDALPGTLEAPPRGVWAPPGPVERHAFALARRVDERPASPVRASSATRVVPDGERAIQPTNLEPRRTGRERGLGAEDLAVRRQAQRIGGVLVQPAADPGNPGAAAELGNGPIEGQVSHLVTRDDGDLRSRGIAPRWHRPRRDPRAKGRAAGMERVANVLGERSRRRRDVCSAGRQEEDDHGAFVNSRARGTAPPDTRKRSAMGLYATDRNQPPLTRDR